MNIQKRVLKLVSSRDDQQLAEIKPKERAVQESTSSTNIAPRSEAINWPETTSRFFTTRRVFVFTVLIPTIVTALYMFIVAADQYKSEADILIKSAQNGAGSFGLTAFLQKSGLSVSASDTYAVEEYLKSRDALRELQQRIDFKEMMQVDEADFIAAYPGYYFFESFENLYDHYKRKVLVETDQTTNIITVSAFTFSGDSSRLVVENLLKLADEFVDNLNEKSLQDALDLAQGGVDRAEAQVKQVKLALTRARREHGVINPEVDLRRISTIVGELTENLIKVEGEITQLEQNAPNSNFLTSLKGRQSFIKERIAQYEEQLIGRDTDEALTSAFESLSALELDAEFSAKALGSARVAYEKARSDALAKQIYLATIVTPHLSDDSRYPKRVVNILTVLALTGGLFIMFWLFVANLREHAE